MKVEPSPPMTREKFIENYVMASRLAAEFASGDVVVLPCNCGRSWCHGWAIVPNDYANIEMHNLLYGPAVPSHTER